MPPTDVQHLFEEHFEAIQSEIEILGKKTSNLRTTRDLLPKLISGKLDVEEFDIDSAQPLGELEEATA